MARRSAPPPRPKTPTLTVGQKRRRLERLQKCVTSLEAFDPQKARKRAPAVLELEAAIDKALASAFGYGTPAYLRYNEAATLDPSPLLTNVAVRAPARPVGGSVRQEPKVQETRQQFSENKERAIALLRSAIPKKKLPLRSRWSLRPRNHRRRRPTCRINSRKLLRRRKFVRPLPGLRVASVKSYGVGSGDGGADPMGKNNGRARQ
jgi:hypothetical protein